MDKKQIQKELKFLDSLDGKRKRPLKIRIAGIILTALIFTIISLPIIGLGIFIGWWIWG